MSDCIPARTNRYNTIILESNINFNGSDFIISECFKGNGRPSRCWILVPDSDVEFNFKGRNSGTNYDLSAFLLV